MATGDAHQQRKGGRRQILLEIFIGIDCSTPVSSALANFM
jgi:hypothetical protein